MRPGDVGGPHAMTSAHRRAVVALQITNVAAASLSGPSFIAIAGGPHLTTSPALPAPVDHPPPTV